MNWRGALVPIYAFICKFQESQLDVNLFLQYIMVDFTEWRGRDAQTRRDLFTCSSFYCLGPTKILSLC